MYTHMLTTHMLRFNLAGIMFEYLYYCFHTVPSSPTDVSVQPLYRVDGSFQYVDVGFTGVVSIKKLMNMFLVLIFTVIISHILRYYYSSCNDGRHNESSGRNVLVYIQHLDKQFKQRC